MRRMGVNLRNRIRIETGFTEPWYEARRAMNTFRRTATVILTATILSTAMGAPPSPVTALAYRPNGANLAAGLRDEVVLLDAASAIVGRIRGQSGPVTALAWSRDGARLAVASGAAGKLGKVRLYAFPANGPAPTQPEKPIA